MVPRCCGLRFLRIPATDNAEEKPPARQPSDRGNRLAVWNNVLDQISAVKSVEAFVPQARAKPTSPAPLAAEHIHKDSTFKPAKRCNRDPLDPPMLRTVASVLRRFNLSAGRT